MRTLREDDGRPSRTALAIATGRAIGYRHLHDPVAARLLPRPERQVVARTRPLAAHRPTADAVALGSGGLTLHGALRMAAIDAAVERAVAAGCQQAVVVGAGLDTRAWRLAALDGIATWEVDLPGTQDAKRRALVRAGLDASRVAFARADLSVESLDQVLGATGHRADRPTAWVWEAVAPYLPPDAVSATLEAIRSRSADGSRLAMTFAHTALAGQRPLTTVAGPLAKLAFRVLGEPILSTYDEWDIASLLSHHGFADPVITTYRDWQRDAGLPFRPDPAGAEMLVTATV